MTAFKLQFDVQADSAEQAIAAVDALRVRSFGRPGTTAGYPPATAALDEATNLWRVVQPVTADDPVSVVFDAAAAADDSNDQVSFVIPGAPAGGGAHAPAAPQLLAEIERLQAELAAARQREAALQAERDQLRAAAAAAPSSAAAGRLQDPPPAAMTPVGPWRPTHLVSGRGLPAWDSPDPTRPSVATLAPWLEVQVLAQVGQWANVLCVNGWQGWVDARQLVTRAG